MYVLIAYLLGILTGVKQGRPIDPTNKSEAENDISSQNSGAAPCTPERIHTKSKPKKQKHSALDLFLAFVHTSTMLGVWYYAILTANMLGKVAESTGAAIRAANFAHDSLELQRSSFHATSGARLKIQYISISKFQQGHSINALIQIENEGSGSARAINLFSNIEFRDSPPIIENAKGGKLKVAHDPFARSPQYVLNNEPLHGRKPGPTNMQVIGPNVSPYISDSFKDGRTKMYVWGSVEFIDEADTTGYKWYVGFCRVLTSQTKTIGESYGLGEESPDCKQSIPAP